MEYSGVKMVPPQCGNPSSSRIEIIQGSSLNGSSMIVFETGEPKIRDDIWTRASYRIFGSELFWALLIVRNHDLVGINLILSNCLNPNFSSSLNTIHNSCHFIIFCSTFDPIFVGLCGVFIAFKCFNIGTFASSEIFRPLQLLKSGGINPDRIWSFSLNPISSKCFFAHSLGFSSQKVSISSLLCLRWGSKLLTLSANQINALRP